MIFLRRHLILQLRLTRHLRSITNCSTNITTARPCIQISVTAQDLNELSTRKNVCRFRV